MEMNLTLVVFILCCSITNTNSIFQQRHQKKIKFSDSTFYQNTKNFRNILNNLNSFEKIENTALCRDGNCSLVLNNTFHFVFHLFNFIMDKHFIKSSISPSNSKFQQNSLRNEYEKCVVCEVVFEFITEKFNSEG